MNTVVLAWSLAGAAALHITEEFAIPGGFKSWYQAYRPQISASVTNRFLFIINGVLLVFSSLVAIAVQAPHGDGVCAWLSLAALLFCNAIFHIVGTFRSGKYSPGVISGVLLYIPLAIFGFAHYVGSGRASLGTAIMAALIGGSYHFVSYRNHLRRAVVANSRDTEADITSPVNK